MQPSFSYTTSPSERMVTLVGLTLTTLDYQSDSVHKLDNSFGRSVAAKFLENA